MKVIIEISAHHCHISRVDLDAIYGSNYKLTPIKSLSQTGQFACREMVKIKVGGKILENVRILGPERKNTQVEISQTEAYHLKVKPPVVECTCPQKAGSCLIAEIIGPKGKVSRCALIIAQRHFHTDPKTAEKLKLTDGRLISVKIPGRRSLTLHQVLVRVNPNFKPRIHLDTDEANAAGITEAAKGELII
ncbi:MAG: PduL/EutD family phosphate acyltransferase [Patescibacteria group bacterium]|jgi:propanediol utilization protein